MARLRQLTPLVVLLATGLPAQAAAPEIERLIHDLSRPAPASIAFTEVRFSPLLDRPLIVSGELHYASIDSLVREVTAPYRERTTIRGESIRVERDGESPRTFALKRAPELRGLLTAFASMLAGDTANLEAHFAIELRGESPWTMTLTPREAQARKRVSHLEMTGHGKEPSCLSLIGADGALNVMLLGKNAFAPLEHPVSPERLNERCASATTPQ
jgi:hypothetical protein